MSTSRPIAEYSRQELYDLIWSTPASKLAADFGISDVAIAKHCRKRTVPRPSRGYWAKVAAGRRPRKAPLPPTPDEFFKQAARQRIPKALPLPGNTESLLPLASELMNALTKAKLDSHKRAQLCQRTLPEVTVSKALAERVAQAFHVILKSVEPLGICFRNSRSAYDSGQLERCRDRLSLTIVEDLVCPDGSRLTSPWWQSGEKGKPSRYLTLLLSPGQYGSREVKQWSESAKLPLQHLLAQAVRAIRTYFLDAQARGERDAIESARRHAEWLQRTREWEQREAIRLQQEKERKHVEALAAAVQARKAALLKAAETWRTSRLLVEFIDECERRWKTGSPTLSAEQVGWLAWAREIAAATSPFSVGYPDCVNDGPFNANSVPFGGPYPATRNFGRTTTASIPSAASVPDTSC